MTDLSALKRDIDLVEIVRQAGVDLRRSGPRLLGSCPFHEDKTPSFFVFPAQGRFHCYGCQASGDCLDFVQQLHGCDFKEALHILGLDRKRRTPKTRAEIKQRQHRQALVQDFRKWETQASSDVATLCRCASKLLRRIKSPEDLERYGSYYHGLEIWQYHLEILSSGDDRAKFGLFERGYYGR